MSRAIDEKRTLVKVSEVFWPSVFEPMPAPITAKYGLSFRLEELPDELLPFAKISKTREGLDIVRIESPHKPIVFCLGDDLRLIPYHLARGVTTERVLTGIPLELAVFSYKHAIRHPSSEGEYETRRLRLAGIRVWERDVMRRSEELMAEFFREDES